MDIREILQLVTFFSCCTIYVLNLYVSDWDFGDTDNVGWLLAVLGWLHVIFD